MTLDLLLDAWPLLLVAAVLGALLMWLWMRQRMTLPTPVVETAISNQAELKAYIVQLEEEVSRKENFIERNKKDRDKLQQKLSQARKSRDNWRGRLKDREAELESLQNLLRRMEGERANLRRALESSKQQAKSQPVAPSSEAPPQAKPEAVEPVAAPEEKQSPQAQPEGPSPAEVRKAETLSRISTRVDEVNFDRIGTATAEEKDDLKQIRGIGPFIEKKLNHLGIFTYRQIANFTPEDEKKVNEVIEFFPGRIRRDQWVAQCRKRTSEVAPQSGED